MRQNGLCLRSLYNMKVIYMCMDLDMTPKGDGSINEIENLGIFFFFFFYKGVESVMVQ